MCDNSGYPIPILSARGPHARPAPAAPLEREESQSRVPAPSAPRRRRAAQRAAHARVDLQLQCHRGQHPHPARDATHPRNRADHRREITARAFRSDQPSRGHHVRGGSGRASRAPHALPRAPDSQVGAHTDRRPERRAISPDPGAYRRRDPYPAGGVGSSAAHDGLGSVAERIRAAPAPGGTRGVGAPSIGLVAIHPFVDGNGRTARLVMNLILFRAGYPPVVILRVNRRQYYRVLMQADADRPAPLVNSVGRAVERSLTLYLEAHARPRPPPPATPDRRPGPAARPAARPADRPAPDSGRDLQPRLSPGRGTDVGPPAAQLSNPAGGAARHPRGAVRCGRGRPGGCPGGSRPAVDHAHL
ncbi:MAG: Fic family protein [Chloroflexi bacterium]|nr:Fic family protein [Chloroflexota bacterium]